MNRHRAVVSGACAKGGALTSAWRNRENRRRWRLVPAALVAASFLVATPMVAAADAHSFVRLKHFVPVSPPRGASDVGPVPGTQRISVTVVLAPSDQSALNLLAANINNPSSPQYHHWLQPNQFDSTFGPSDTTFAAIDTWLRTDGLSDLTTSYFSVRATGSESAIAAAMGTSFERYRMVTGQVGRIARQAPLVPDNLAGGQIRSILGLDTLGRPEPPDGAAPPPIRGTNEESSIAPNATCQHASSSYSLSDESSAYGISTLVNDGLDGTGQTIGLFEPQGEYTPSSVATYMSCAGLTNTVRSVNVNGGVTVPPKNLHSEADLDVEEAATQAPGATIVVYQGPTTTDWVDDWYDELTVIVRSNPSVVSISYDQCETIAKNDGIVGAADTLFYRAMLAGESIFVASGDYGAEGCLPWRGAHETSGVTGTAIYNNAISLYPATDPYITSVGGTSLTGGDPRTSPETVWNDCEDTESLACAVTAHTDYAAGGGGLSAYESATAEQPNVYPQWNSATFCGTHCREVPDVSADAAPQLWVYTAPTDGGWWHGSGGTSAAAPLMAGLAADRNTGCSTRTGDFDPALYALYHEGAYGTAFNDITVGDNDETGSFHGAYWKAAPGYDLASGIGSPIGEGLACPEVTSVSPSSAAPGSEVTVSGLALEHASILFNGTNATVVASDATSATVIVPAGSGTQTVKASSVLGQGTQSAPFTIVGPPAPSVATYSGYDMVGSDGGVFVFPTGSSSGFYGSLPGLGVHVNNIVGMVPTSNNQGYFLVGSDGGVFAFGNAPFLGSLPGLGVTPAQPITGIVATSTDGGYFLVGRDGGVYAFGNAPFEGSLPYTQVHVDNIVGIAATASGGGYWVVSATGTVYAFGTAKAINWPLNTSSPVSAIAGTPDGGGYWIVTQSGALYCFGDAQYFGSLPGLGVSPAKSVIGIVHTADTEGYWLIGSDGGIFAFGDAGFVGSLPGLGVNVADVVGAVPTG